MSNITRDQVCAAVPRAVRRMRANPSKIGSTALATDSEGNSVPVDHPDACKFCALGFLALELGVSERTTTSFVHDLIYSAQLDSDKVRDVYVMNDNGVELGNLFAGIPALEALCTF